MLPNKTQTKDRELKDNGFAPANDFDKILKFLKDQNGLFEYTISIPKKTKRYNLFNSILTVQKD